MKILIMLLLAAQPVCAQWTDDFNDGDLLNGPVWTQTPGSFIINTAGELQSASQNANQTFFITTPSSQATGEWRFTVRLNLATSGANYADVFVMAADAQLSNTSTTGYFVRIGGTEDAISLFRKDTGSVVRIIQGTNGSVQTNVTYEITVIRTNDFRWLLMYKVQNTLGEVSDWVLDARYQTSTYFGFSVTQSSASFFEKHFFDDVYVGNITPDVTPPKLEKVLAVDSVHLSVEFDEPVVLNGYLPALFYVDNGVGFPQQVNCLGSKCMLQFASSFPDRVALPLTVHEVKDLWGNVAMNLTDTFYFSTPQWGDLVIHEIFADPDPPQQMPTVEWVEIRNSSAFPIQLAGWKICKASTCSGSFPEYVLMPDSLLIVGSSNAVAAMDTFGNALSISSFPSLNNSGDILWLQSNQEKLIHTVTYSDEWYGNPIKRVGGWSLEMIDVHQPCVGESNWIASNNPRGATPGKRNSVEGIINDDQPLHLKRGYAIDSFHIRLYFTKPLKKDQILLTNIRFHEINMMIDSIMIEDPTHQTILVTLQTPMLHGMIYQLIVESVQDCSGNMLQPTTLKVALAEEPLPGDVIVNEILFNPMPSGTDFVELYNKSDKVIDLKLLHIANRLTDGTTGNISLIHLDGFAFFPGTFVVISNNQKIVQIEYHTQNHEGFIDMNNLPAYNDDKGTVILLNRSGDEVDVVSYSDDWHFPLLGNTEGVSLERIQYEGLSNQKAQWHSAARNVGYATPGYENSQRKTNLPGSSAQFNYSSEIVSPNNDGHEDYLVIDYHFPQVGYMSNVIIFDINGRSVRILHRNILNGTTGTWRWDGLGERQQQLTSGRYIVLIEVFDINGGYEKFKKVITVTNK